jgi:hypothetical protein
MLQRIQSGGHATVALVILRRRAPEEAQRPGLGQRLRARAQNLALDLYNRHDHRGALARDAFEPMDASGLLAGVRRLEVTPRTTRFSDRLEEADLEVIRACGLDVLVRLGFRILRGGVLEAARHGVWSYHHGDNRVNRGGPAGFWEVMEGQPETGAVLQVLSEDLDNGLVLDRTVSATHPLSVRRNRNELYWKASQLLPRQLGRLQAEGAQGYFARVRRENEPLQLYDRRLYSTQGLGNRHMLGYLARLQRQRLRNQLRARLYRDQWSLRYQFSPQPATSLWRMKEIKPPPDRFWADPHILVHQGEHYLFCEEFLYEPWKGRVVCMKLGRDGQVGPPTVALELPTHLSYPYVFSWCGRHYMIPESASQRRVELYVCARFPDRWERCATLMEDVHAVDATLLRRDGRWWMFTNMVQVRGASSWDELFLFSRRELTRGRWEPHRLNPLISDAGRARPAGRLFTWKGRLYRPSQRCTPRYGYGLHLNEVTTLSREDYREVTVTSAQPLWSPRLRGVHTYSHHEGLTVIDAMSSNPRGDLPAWLRRRL